MNGCAEFEANPAAGEPLAVVRRLYDAWNAGTVAGAAELVSPAVRWESFGTSLPVDGPEGLQATLAGGAWGGTWMLSPVTVDLLVCVVDRVIACSRRSGPHGKAEAEWLEVWTLRDGQVVHYRGYPLDEGLTVLSQTTGSRRLEAVCRSVLAFNRGDVGGWVQLFELDVQFVSAEQDVRRGLAGMRLVRRGAPSALARAAARRCAGPGREHQRPGRLGGSTPRRHERRAAPRRAA